MANDEVQTRNNESENRYEAWVGDELAGISEYRLRDGRITFTHTEVKDEWEGEGVGSELVRDALDDVRRQGTRKVVPACPFVKEWIADHPDYEDLLA